MPRMIRKYGKRAGASGNYNLRGSHSSDPSRVNEGMNLEHDITSTDTFSIDLYTMNTRYLSPPTWQDSLIDTNDPMLSKRKRPKSDASFGENERVDRENKRGEKWTEEEEALLRERRNGEPESWEETGRYFVGRTINALQKKWKLMALSDKMKMDPVLESNLMNAVAKHAPDFYRRLAAEMEMSEEQVEIIEDKISILFLQGKLPLKSNPPILMPTYETPITQKACTAPSRLPKYYSDSYGDPAGNTGFQSGLCYPSYRLPSETLDSNSLLGSPVVGHACSSDSGESMRYTYGDGDVAMEKALEGIYVNRFSQSLNFSDSMLDGYIGHVAPQRCREDYILGGYCSFTKADDINTMDGVVTQMTV